MKKIIILLFIFFPFFLFSQESIYSSYTHTLFRCSPFYECLNNINITNRGDEIVNILEKGAFISFPENNWGGIKWGQIENNKYISATYLAIKNSDIFDEYVTYKTELGDNNERWVPIWYFEALEKKNRDVIAQAEPNRLTWDADIAPDVWYKDIPQVASVVISNTGMTFYTPLEVKLTGFLFGELKKVSDTSYEAVAYPAIQDTNEVISWKPNAENFPTLTDGNPVRFRYEINGKQMKIYNGETGKIVFDLIQMPYEWVTLYEEFIRTNKIPASLSQPEEYSTKTKAIVLSVSQNYIVTESLRLRKEESTSSATLHTMKAGTKVTILQLGKEQTIDGITANWVQVEVLDASLEEPLSNSASTSAQRGDVQRTTGWCFGGYLLEQ